MIYTEAVMVVIIVLSVLVVIVASLLVFAKIYNQKRHGNQRKIEYFHGYPTTGVTYPKPEHTKLEYDSNGRVVSVDDTPVKDWIDNVWR